MSNEDPTRLSPVLKVEKPQEIHWTPGETPYVGYDVRAIRAILVAKTTSGSSVRQG